MTNLDASLREKEHKIIDTLYKLSYKQQQVDAYKSQHLWNEYRIVDENKSVKWNKEQITDHNKTVCNDHEIATKEIQEETDKVLLELFECIKEIYADEKITYSMFQSLWDRACFEVGDCSHYWNIIDEIKCILEDFFELLKLQRKED